MKQYWKISKGRYSRACVGSLSLVIGYSMWFPSTALAETGDTLSVEAAIGEQYDDNLFRIPSGMPATAVTGVSQRSDLITTTTLGLKFDKSYSLQHFTVDANLTNYNYQTYSYLGFTAQNLNAKWQWSITPDLTGNLEFGRSQLPVSFYGYQSYNLRNISTVDSKRFDADLKLAAGWHVGMSINQLQQLNDQPVFALEDVRINSEEANAHYEFSTGNSLGIYVREGSGIYPYLGLDTVNLIDTEFVEHEAGVRATWQYDERSGITAQIGKLTRDHAHFASRNFSGMVGQASYTWAMTGKTSIIFGASRVLSSFQVPSSSYVYTDTYSVGPMWAITDKSNIRALLQEIQFKFGGAIVPSGADREDIIHAVALVGTWTVFRNLSAVATLSHSNRISNQLGLGFSDNTISVVADYNY